jgi:integrase
VASFAQIAQRWLEDVELTRSAATRRLYGLAVDQVMRALPELAQRPITRADLLAFRSGRAKNVSASSVNRELRAVRTLLLWSELNELDHPRVQTKRLLLPQPAPRERALTDDEWSRVVEEARWDMPAEVILRVCRGTGFRLGEALSLTWGDIDFERGTLSVRPHEGFTPKTPAALRTVAAPELCRWLGEWRRTLGCRGSADLVCPRDPLRGGDWNYPASTRVCARLRAIYRRAGVTGKRLTHSLRHALARDLVASGAPINAAQRHLGHASAHTTLQIYARADQSDVEAAGRALEAWRQKRPAKK